MSPGGSIASGFCTSAAAGILLVLSIPPFRELGRFFFAFNAGLSFAFLCLSAPFRPGPLRILAERPPQRAGGDSLASLAAAVALALVFAYVAALYAPGGRTAKSLLAAAAASALLATAVDGWRAAGPAGAGWVFGANALAASALLGSVIVAMNLGHWYLVRARLSASHLVRLALAMAAAVGARAVLSAAGLLSAAARSPLGARAFMETMAVDRAVFFWPRLFFGLFGPAVFAYMVYETARIRSTQSATGILYIAVIFVMMGEFLARYLSVAGAVAL